MSARIRPLRYLALAAPLAALTVLWASAQGGGHRLDAGKISTAAGTKAITTKDGVVRLAWARTDVKVKVDGMPFKPAAGLGSWAAFTPAPHGAMVMGDTVVFQDEVTPAMDAAFASGLEVTGLHNHFFYDEPKVYFMHIGGQGDPEKLAAGVKNVWDAIKKVRADHATPANQFAGKVPTDGNLDAGAIEKALGHKSETTGGVVKVTIAREGTMHGVKVGGSMGLTTWAAFSGSDELAAVDGDFIMTAAEVQPVLHALRKGGIHIVALHNHMVGEQPAYYFTHFWGKGRVEDLAKGLRAALDVQRKAGKTSRAGKVRSGPQAGRTLPGPFHPLDVVEGRRIDYIDGFGADAVVLLFVRSLGGPLPGLVAKLDKEVARHRQARLHAVVVLLSDEDGVEEKLKELGRTHRVKDVRLTLDNPAGPRHYNIARDAALTAILYRQRKVVVNHAFGADELNDEAAAKVLADVPKVLPRPADAAGHRTAP
jgi:hypothetical protein